MLVSSKFLPLISAQQEMGNIETCYQGALTDADRVLVFLREPDNPAALIARGDAYYFLGRFEHALVRRVGIMEDHIYYLPLNVGISFPLIQTLEVGKLQIALHDLHLMFKSLFL